MKKIITIKVFLIIGLLMLLAFSINNNSVDTYLKITDGTNYLELYLEDDTAHINSNVPLIYDVPNLIDFGAKLDSMQSQIDDIGEMAFENGYYYISSDTI